MIKIKNNKMEIISTAFKEGMSIPAKYTCDNLDSSSPLEWSKVPSGTKSFALIGDDPDAPSCTWVHWVLYNIPGKIRELHENQPKMETLNDPGQLNFHYSRLQDFQPYSI
jgi:Raf kinase inhibitor-like YbhB/YbcL family protein